MRDSLSLLGRWAACANECSPASCRAGCRCNRGGLRWGRSRPAQHGTRLGRLPAGVAIGDDLVVLAFLSKHINPKYGAEPGKLFYTHISDQYAPFSFKVVSVGVRDSTYVLYGLLHPESDLRIEEHYTDTAGSTDHVFALMHLLGFRFAPL